MERETIVTYNPRKTVQLAWLMVMAIWAAPCVAQKTELTFKEVSPCGLNVLVLKNEPSRYRINEEHGWCEGYRVGTRGSLYVQPMTVIDSEIPILKPEDGETRLTPKEDGGRIFFRWMVPDIVANGLTNDTGSTKLNLDAYFRILFYNIDGTEMLFDVKRPIDDGVYDLKTSLVAPFKYEDATRIPAIWAKEHWAKEQSERAPRLIYLPLRVGPADSAVQGSGDRYWFMFKVSIPIRDVRYRIKREGADEFTEHEESVEKTICPYLPRVVDSGEYLYACLPKRVLAGGDGVYILRLTVNYRDSTGDVKDSLDLRFYHRGDGL